jgi:hypothetical protein
VIDEMGRGLGHPPGVARGADGAAFAVEGHQEILAAPLATRPGEAASGYRDFTKSVTGGGETKQAIRFSEQSESGAMEGAAYQRHIALPRA